MNKRNIDKKDNTNAKQDKVRKNIPKEDIKKSKEDISNNEEEIKKTKANSKTKNNSTLKDQKIKDAFVFSNKITVLNKKTARDSKSNQKSDEDKNIPRSKRSRVERSKSKKKEREESEEKSDEEVPTNLKKKTVKIQKKKQEKDEDIKKEEEVEEVTVIKNSKKKNTSKSKEETSSKRRAKSVPNKTNKTSKKSRKEESEVESESEEEDEEHSEDEWEEEKENKKYNKNAKKSAKSQNPKKPSNVQKKTKQNTKYKRGKENPNVEIQSSCKYLESKEPILFTDCCVHCNNRNIIRAVKSGNIQLLKKSISAKELISSINDEWSKEYPVTPIELAILREDKSMISEIITNEMNFQRIHDRVSKPIQKISEAETGESSIYAYGVRTRKLNMTRGNRVGNNAFLDDNNNMSDFNTTIINTVLQKCKDPKLIDYITAAMTDPLNKNNHLGGSSIDFNSQLQLAVAAGNRVIAHFLLERMIKNNINANYGYNQLHCSVLEYKDDKFDVTHKTSLNKKTIGNTTTLTPVGVACINPNESVLKRLIDLGGDWHFADFNGYKPIHYAAACVAPGPLRLLLSIGAHVDEPTKDKTTPLIIASKYGRLENVKLLLKSKANIIHKNKKGNTALHEAAENGHVEVLRTILEHDDISVDLPGKDRMTPLIIAAAHGNKDCINVLLDSGAKVLKKDKFKRTALLLACKSGQTVIASILLRHGSDFNLPDSSANSPLHYACAYGWLEIVKLLLQAGANVNSTNMWKISPLEVAMLKNHFGIVKYLLNNSQVDVNMKFDKSNTLLHHSFTKVSDKSLSEIEYLLFEKKADTNIPNIHGKTCIHLLAGYNFNDYLANNLQKNRNYTFCYHNNNELKPEELLNLKSSHAKIIQKLYEILKSNGAEINLKTVENKTPLQIAIEKRNYVMIELLLDSDPEIVFVDSTNQTILHLLSDLVFDEEGESSLKKMIDVILKNQNIQSLSNIVDDKGFTPILKLFYFYSENVKSFFDKIQAKEISFLKTKIYNQSLKLENQQNKSKLEKNGLIESNREDMEDSEDQSEFSLENKSVMPKKKWTNLGKVAIKYGIDSSTNESESDKINRIVLTSEDMKIVLENSREKFFNYIHTIFKEIVLSFISIGCDANRQVQKTKKWRDRKEGEEIKEEQQQDFNNNQPGLFNNFNFGFKPNIYSKMAHPAAPSKSVSFGNMKTRRNAIKIQPCNNISKTTVKHDIANEYHGSVGLSNITMLLMAFPIADLLKYIVEDLKVDLNITDIYEQNSLFYLIKNYSKIEAIQLEAFNNTIDHLLKYNIKVNQYDRDGNSTFFLLSKLWNLDKMTKFYNYGANINKMNKQGENALIYFIRTKEKYKVELLLKNFNIDINYRDDKMRTAVHYLYNDEESSADIDVSLKQIILSKNPDVNVKDIMKRTPLHYLFVKIGKEFDKSHIDPIVALSTLLDIKDIEINAQDIFGNTPLHYASQRGATICAMSLIQKTNINNKNYEGNTALGYSLLFKHPNFSIVLIQQNANIYDNVYPLQNRSEEDIIKKEKKTEKNLSQTRLNTSQVIDLNTSSQFDMNNGDMLLSDPNEAFNLETELNQVISEESDLDEDDDDISLDDDNNNTYNQGQFTSFNKIPAKKQIGFQFNPNTYNNYNSYNNVNEAKYDLLNYKDINSNYFKSKENKEKGISMFRMCVKNEYQGLTYLFVNQGYDLMKAIQDAFYENKFNLAMLLLDKCPYDEIYRSTNEKQQNLFHILALYGKSVQNKRELDLFFDKLSEKGLRLDLPDADGYTPIHYACENHFEDLFEYILNKHDSNKVLNSYTNLGFTPFICTIRGKLNISKSFKQMEVILNKVDKKQISLLYYEEHYGVSYKCTPLLHATRSFLEKSYKTDPILTEEGKKLIKLIEFGASVMEKDSDGIDCLMHCVKENNIKLLQLFVENCKNNIVYDAIDYSGRSLLHYAVSPLPEGSFENENLLSYLIRNGFATNIKDIHGKTPYCYATEQETGTNLRILKQYNVAPKEFLVLRRQKSIILLNDWPQPFVNYEKDAEEYYHKMSNLLSAKQEIKILPDPNGNFPEDTHEVIKDDVTGYYDVILTKVKVHAGLYGEYNFYKMQLIHDKGRDVFILWNRFGRIGEVGQYQRTPFNTLQEAQTEFKKIFKSKSGNEWENKSNFKRIRGKYMLLNINEWKISHKDLLEPFDFKKSPESSISSKEIKNLIRNFTNSAIYYKALKDSGIDTDLLNFNYLNKELILKARSILGEINKIMQEIALLRANKNASGHYDEDVINKVLDFKNEIYELSSRYYELIPKSKFKNMAVTALDNENQLKEEIHLLENLTYVENAVKILLAAQYRQKEINPVDYCLNSMNILIDLIVKESNEFVLLEKYIKQNSNQQLKIINIFKIQRKGEAENITRMSIPNHLLLFHGSKVFNFIGILSNGLKIAPPEAPVTGYMFGKGVYFADMFDKSYGYCDSLEYDDERGKKKNHKYMLMCEVALGKMFEVGVDNEFDQELTFLKSKNIPLIILDGYHSLKSLAREELDPNGKFVMNNGVTIPLGKSIPSNPIDNKMDRRTYHTEYVVYDTSQIRIRYLIQIEDERY